MRLPIAPFALTILASLRPTSALNILVPVYNYPTDNFAPVVSAAISHRDIQFYTIVNPDSGPGSSQYPDENYSKAIANLNDHPNILTLGYVHTSSAKRPYGEISAEVGKYAGWADHQGGNITVAGIFFDEAPHDSSDASFEYMSDASALTYDKIPYNQACVVFNPGTVVDAGKSQDYFGEADVIVQFEDFFNKYQGQKSIDTFPKGTKKQSAIILHDTPESADIAGLVQEMKASGVGWVYFCTDTNYKDLSLLEKTADAIATGH